MKQMLSTFAYFGAKPLFKERLRPEQSFFPSWERLEASMKGIFERQYYNNNGPLHTELEQKLQNYFGIKHVICASNENLALMMLADALELKGKVIVPTYAPAGTIQSLNWAGLTPIPCSVDLKTQHINTNEIESLIDDDVSGILGVNLWGEVSDIDKLEEIANKFNLKLYFDSSHALGCEYKGKKVANFGLAEVFSFHSSKILNSLEGGCICTNDDALAARLICIRPSYGLDYNEKVVRVTNSRMSEAQAALALLSLEDLESNMTSNELFFSIYNERLSQIRGIEIFTPKNTSRSNYQYINCFINQKEFGISRDKLVKLLNAENITTRTNFYQNARLDLIFPKTEIDQSSFEVALKLGASSIQLPNWAGLDEKIIHSICDFILNVQNNSLEISKEHV